MRQSVLFGLIAYALMPFLPTGSQVRAQAQEGQGAAEDHPVPEGAELTTQFMKGLFDTVSCRDRGHTLPVVGYAEYCGRLDEQLYVNRSAYIIPGGTWLDAHLPDYPVTVVYPFSGADLMSSTTVYPEAFTFIHLTYDPGGRVNALAEMTPVDRGEALTHLLEDALQWLLVTGYSSTDSLRRARRASLTGLLAATLVGLHARGGDVVYLRYLKVKRDGAIVYKTDQEMGFAGKPPRKLGPRDYRSFELGFTLPGSGRLRRLVFIWANLKDVHMNGEYGLGIQALLKKHPGFGVLNKAGEYNLWRQNFKVIREVLVHHGALMVSDSSGIPEIFLEGTSWEITPYGVYECDQTRILKQFPYLKPIHKNLLKTFQRSDRQPLGFRFGYKSCKGEDNLMIHWRAPYR